MIVSYGAVRRIANHENSTAITEFLNKDVIAHAGMNLFLARGISRFIFLIQRSGVKNRTANARHMRQIRRTKIAVTWRFARACRCDT
jgi:hypothetical protein